MYKQVLKEDNLENKCPYFGRDKYTEIKIQEEKIGRDLGLDMGTEMVDSDDSDDSDTSENVSEGLESKDLKISKFEDIGKELIDTHSEDIPCSSLDEINICSRNNDILMFHSKIDAIPPDLDRLYRFINISKYRTFENKKLTSIKVELKSSKSNEIGKSKEQPNQRILVDLQNDLNYLDKFCINPHKMTFEYYNIILDKNPVYQNFQVKDAYKIDRKQKDMKSLDDSWSDISEGEMYNNPQYETTNNLEIENSNKSYEILKKRFGELKKLKKFYIKGKHKGMNVYSIINNFEDPELTLNTEDPYIFMKSLQKRDIEKFSKNFKNPQNKFVNYFKKEFKTNYNEKNKLIGSNLQANLVMLNKITKKGKLPEMFLHRTIDVKIFDKDQFSITDQNKDGIPANIIEAFDLDQTQNYFSHFVKLEFIELFEKFHHYLTPGMKDLVEASSEFVSGCLNDVLSFLFNSEKKRSFSIRWNDIVQTDFKDDFVFYDNFANGINVWIKAFNESIVKLDQHNSKIVKLKEIKKSQKSNFSKNIVSDFQNYDMLKFLNIIEFRFKSEVSNSAVEENPMKDSKQKEVKIKYNPDTELMNKLDSFCKRNKYSISDGFRTFFNFTFESYEKFEETKKPKLSLTKSYTDYSNNLLEKLIKLYNQRYFNYLFITQLFTVKSDSGDLINKNISIKDLANFIFIYFYKKTKPEIRLELNLTQKFIRDFEKVKDIDHWMYKFRKRILSTFEDKLKKGINLNISQQYRMMNLNLIKEFLFVNFLKLSSMASENQNNNVVKFNQFLQFYLTNENNPNNMKDFTNLFFHFIFFASNRELLVINIVKYIESSVIQYQQSISIELKNTTENQLKHTLNTMLMPIITKFKVNYREALVMTHPAEYQTCPFVFYENVVGEERYFVKKIKQSSDKKSVKSPVEEDPQPFVTKRKFKIKKSRRLVLLKERIIRKLDLIQGKYQSSVRELLKNLDL